MVKIDAKTTLPKSKQTEKTKVIKHIKHLKEYSLKKPVMERMILEDLSYI